MTAYMVAELWCNACGERFTTDGEPTIPELRAVAKKQGWQRVKVEGMEDRCPDCPAGVAVDGAMRGALIREDGTLRSGGASRSGCVGSIPAEPVRQPDTASTVSDGAPIVRGAGDANGTFVAKTAGA